MPAFVAQSSQTVHTGNFISRRAVILGQFSFDDGGGIVLVGNDEVRGLIEASDTVDPFRLAVADFSLGQDLLS